MQLSRAATHAALVVAALALAALGCGADEDAIARGAEKLIRERIGPQVGAEIESVSCPESVPARKGYAFNCVATSGDGSRASVRVTEVNDTGRIHAEGLLRARTVERGIRRFIRRQAGYEAVVTCPELVEVRRGARFACDARDGRQRHEIGVTVVDDAGRTRFQESAITSAEGRRVGRALAQTRAHPRDAAAWTALTGALLTLARTPQNFDAASQSYNDGGRDWLRRAADAWRFHLRFAEQPDATTAARMVGALTALDRLGDAVRAQEIVIAARDATPALYLQLANLAYAAGQERKADRAGRRALELAPGRLRPALERQLRSARALAAD
jgi:Domain of unknown function (DUF4333)